MNSSMNSSMAELIEVIETMKETCRRRESLQACDALTKFSHTLADMADAQTALGLATIDLIVALEKANRP